MEPRVPFPSLDGQPAWVVILTVLLVVSGGLGVAYLTAKARNPTVPVKEPVTVSPDLEPNMITVIHAAMEHLAETARREAEQGEVAQAEATRLRYQLNKAEKSLRKAQAELEACQKHARELALKAWDRDT